MRARLPPLNGFQFPVSDRSELQGLISRKSKCTVTSHPDEFFPSDHSEMPSTREPSPEPFWDATKPHRGAKYESDSSTESTYSDRESRNTQHYLSESDSGDDDFFPSDHSNMPSTREPSPEPFWDTAKRYGWRPEDIFPQRKMFLTPESHIPVLHSSSYPLSSSAQCNPTENVAQFNGQEVCFKRDVESGICNHMDDVSTNQPSQPSFDDMQTESRKLGRTTTWLRVVHRGYGQVAWRNALENTNLTIVYGPFASEGDYVLIPDGLCAQDIVDMMIETNLVVRKLVWFKAMKRANKSRVLFKWAPFSVSPIGDEKPVLAETKAFCGTDR